MQNQHLQTRLSDLEQHFGLLNGYSELLFVILGKVLREQARKESKTAASCTPEVADEEKQQTLTTNLSYSNLCLKVM